MNVHASSKAATITRGLPQLKEARRVARSNERCRFGDSLVPMGETFLTVSGVNIYA